MTFYTNNKKFGGYFDAPLTYRLGNCKSGIFATGYISQQTIKDYKPSILKVVKKGGSFNLIVGMAYYEGLKKGQYETLKSLHKGIISINPNGGGVKLVYVQRFHGKIYNLICESEKHIYLGSSNFSETGLRDNLEGTIEIKNNATVRDVSRFLNWLNDDKQSAYIDKIEDIKILDSKFFKRDVGKPTIGLHEAGKYDISTIKTDKLRYLDISLSRRIAARQKSSLNTYFGKGRWQRESGNVIPRGWFEGEVIVDIETTRKEIYPNGNFKVITDDGYTFECRSQGDYHKNIRSTGSLHTLGKWLKLKLQKSGALAPLTLVTAETFEKYGQDNLRLYKLSKGVYFMEFKPKT